MKTKILILGLMCLFIFAYCNSPADPEIEKALNPGNPGNPGPTEDDPPVILYFYEEHIAAGSHNIFWGVAETPVATVITSWGSGEVPLTGITTVWVSERTTYTLTATNGAGETSESITIEPKERAVLEVAMIPEIPIFHYHLEVGSPDRSYSNFTIIITETNGIGGTANIRPEYPPTGSCGGALYNMKFDPFGSVSHPYDACANGRPTTMIIKITGSDDNGYTIDTQVEIPFTWDN